MPRNCPLNNLEIFGWVSPEVLPPFLESDCPLMMSDEERRGPMRDVRKPKVNADASGVVALRASSCSWADITTGLGFSKGTAQRAPSHLLKTV